MADPDALPDNLAQARQLYRARKFDEAAAIYRSHLAETPGDAVAWEGLASSAFLSGDLETAREAFEKLVSLRPLEGKFLINLGAVLNRLERHAEALEVLKKAVQREKRSADAYYNLGYAHRKLGQATLAITAYREAVRLDPKMEAAYQNMGNVYADQGNHTLAIMNYKKALDINPRFEKALRGLAQSEAALTEQRETANPFGRLVNTESQSGPAIAAHGQTMNEQERADDRQQLRQIADKLEYQTRDCIEFLKTVLEPQLMSLQRIVAEDVKGGGSIVKSAGEFMEAAEKWAALRKQLRRGCLELRAHEELVAMSSIKIDG